MEKMKHSNTTVSSSKLQFAELIKGALLHLSVYRASIPCLSPWERKPLTFSYDNLDNTATAYNKLVKRISALSRDGEPDMAKAEELTKGFSEALDNDLNTSLALTCVYDVLKADADDATKLYVIGEFDKVLSLDLTKVPESNKAMKRVEADRSALNRRSLLFAQPILVFIRLSFASAFRST